MHAANPVDWWEWEEAAFEEPGDATCRCWWRGPARRAHWRTRSPAAYLNEHFVSIKIDREERPDVDAVYMNATRRLPGTAAGR